MTDGGPTPRLEVDSLRVSYGRAIAVDGISLAVSPGSCVGVVGANGAGKSSLLKSIAGVVRSEEGRVRLDGADVRNASPWTMARRGVRLVPESKELFWGLSVGENLRVGARAVPAHGRRESIEAALEVFPRLRRLSGSLARSLSGGEQQMLAIARALAGEPRLLLLDEPALGLAPAIVAQLVDSLRQVRTRGMSILLAEQNLAVPRQLCDEVGVWQLGHVIAAGSPHDVLSEDVLRTAFLGAGGGNAARG